MARDKRPTGVGLLDPRYHAQGGGLATSVRAHQASDYPPPNSQGEVVDHGPLAIPLGEAVHAETVGQKPVSYHAMAAPGPPSQRWAGGTIDLVGAINNT